MKEGNNLQKEARGAANIIKKYLDGQTNDIDVVKKASNTLNKAINQYTKQTNKEFKEMRKILALYDKIKKHPAKEKESAALLKKIKEYMRN